MIKSKEDLKYYLKCDKVALKINSKKKFPSFFDSIWKYEIVLRKCEYHKNTNHRLLYYFYKYRLNRMGEKLTLKFEPNVFGPGLSIAHYGTIIVNPNAKVGANCRIHEGVTIGATNGSSNAPKIGDNCFIGSGAKIIGDISIGDNVAIGAGAVVVSDIKDNVTVGGVPAKIISNNNSSSNIINATEMVLNNEKK